jgi:hypothetical protein
MHWNAETVIVRGLKLETGPPGTYNWIVHFLGDDFEATKELVLHVDDKPSLNLICINPDHQTHRVTQCFTPSPSIPKPVEPLARLIFQNPIMRLLTACSTTGSLPQSR